MLIKNILAKLIVNIKVKNIRCAIMELSCVCLEKVNLNVPKIKYGLLVKR